MKMSVSQEGGYSTVSDGGTFSRTSTFDKERRVSASALPAP
jgi:hypothetical protein